MEWLIELHPASQIFAIIGLFTAICIAIWQFGKFLRGE